MWTPHRNADALPALGQRAHNLFTDEAGTAEHNNQIVRHELPHHRRFSVGARM
jgi:hypothetical protein